MRQDPIPTFRRAARWAVRIATSRTFRQRVGASVLALAALSGVGLLASAASRAACERETRQTLENHRFARWHPRPRWLDETALRAVPCPFRDSDWGGVYADRCRSVFAPKVAYRPRPPIDDLAEDRPGESWGYVKCRVALPFVVRAHYACGYSAPRKQVLADSSVASHRSGFFVEGVVTYVGAFGLVMPIHDWEVGASFH